VKQGSFILAWATAICVTGVFVFAVIHGAQQPPAETCAEIVPPTEHPIIVIGSSRTHSALPLDMPAQGILGDGRHHHIWTMPNISFVDTMFLLKCALATDAETILVETNSLVFGQNVKRNRTLVEKPTLVDIFDRAAWEFTQATGMLKRTLITQSDYTNVWDGVRPSVYAVTEQLIPLGALDEITELPYEAKERIYLFEPPTTELYQEDILASVDIEPVHAFEQAHDATGINVLKFWPMWSPPHFSDYTSHLNAVGRARFLRELQMSWKGGHDSK
jgi:hypothetical protein